MILSGFAVAYFADVEIALPIAVNNPSLVLGDDPAEIAGHLVPKPP